MKNKIITKTVVVLSCFLTLSTVALPSATVFASTYSVSDKATQVSKRSTATNSEGKHIYVDNGRILEFDKDTVLPLVPERHWIQAAKMDRGKWSFSVTAIRKGYSKLPSNVKRWINQYIGLNSILSTLEHFTGWIEDGIYQACKRAGMPDWMAWTVAKALTLIAL